MGGPGEDFRVGIRGGPGEDLELEFAGIWEGIWDGNLGDLGQDLGSVLFRNLGDGGRGLGLEFEGSVREFGVGIQGIPGGNLGLEFEKSR